MGNIPLTPPSVARNTSQIYKPAVYKSVADTYIRQLEDYNRPFKSLARVNAYGRIELSTPMAYNPPQPVWVVGFDPIFYEDIITYNAQIAKLASNNTDLRMVDVLNNPPTPPPPPASIIVADPVPQPIGNPVNYLPPSIAPNAEQKQIPGYSNYVLMYTMGRNYLAIGQNYAQYVVFDPPTLADNTYQKQLAKFVRLYDQIRLLNALNTGSEVFDMPFIAPNYSASGRIESFVDAVETEVTSTQIDQCMNVNTAQETWYVNQILDTQGKFDAQRAICETKGLKYDATKCGITNCIMPYNSRNTTAPPEPQTGAQYNFNRLTFSASGYPAKLDQTNYATQLATAETFKASDIEKYFNILNDYNFYWKNENGWRQIDDPAKPYNPPLPPWLNLPGNADGFAKQYHESLAAFNEKVIAKLKAFNNYENINLPADFGPLPPSPPYPYALYELLTKPRLFLTPVAASNLKTSGNAANTNSDIKYEVPVTELPILYEAAKKRQPAPPAESKKPQCNTGSEVCIKYDDEISDAAKLLLKNMEAQRKLQERALKQQQPSNIENATDKLNSYYETIRGDIRSLVSNILGSN
jgi:hypothetical protein